MTSILSRFDRIISHKRNGGSDKLFIIGEPYGIYGTVLCGIHSVITIACERCYSVKRDDKENYMLFVKVGRTSPGGLGVSSKTSLLVSRYVMVRV